jgi:glycosyltransferase involved in cell wall biosynthesis
LKKTVSKKSTRKKTVTKNSNLQISVILPVYNEEENINLQYEKLTQSLTEFKRSYEIIFIDDGSYDKSPQLLEEIANKDKHVKIIEFRRNFGQTAAMHAGIEYSQGEIIVFMDSDLQNDSDDIPRLVEKLEEGYDVVSGWRKKRKDKFFSRRLPSILANSMIAWITGVKLHDLGCTLKVFKAEILKKVKLYGEMHRFIPVHASWIGASITELPVQHHPRRFGKSKYGLIRTFKVLLDLITVKFLGSFSTKPIYLYGGMGIITMILAFASGLAVILMKVLNDFDITGNPFFLLFFLFVILSVILALMGIQAEILIRVYHESTQRTPYHIKSMHNITIAD